MPQDELSASNMGRRYYGVFLTCDPEIVEPEKSCSSSRLLPFTSERFLPSFHWKHKEIYFNSIILLHSLGIFLLLCHFLPIDILDSLLFFIQINVTCFLEAVEKAWVLAHCLHCHRYKDKIVQFLSLW